MEIIHNLGSLSINKSINENVGFLLTNKKGSYCSFFNTPSSRYQGLFYFDERAMKMYKFIESIELIGNNDVSNLKNCFYFIERRKETIIEAFLMPKGFNSLIYELNAINEIDLVLDCKDSYDNRELGRYYDISEEKGCIIIKFTKKTDKREDSSDGTEEFAMYLAIKKDSNSYEKNSKWVERHYSYDEERKSPPSKRYVYNALRLKSSKFVFSMAKKKSSAIEECEYIFNNVDQIKNKEKEYFFEMLKNEPTRGIIKNEKINNEVKVAYISALNSLNNLIVHNKSRYNIFAGLPWFFQFWSRDALISLKALSKINRELAEKMLFGYLNRIGNDGRLPSLIGKNESEILGSSDAHGWLFFRCNEIIEKINKNKDTINSMLMSLKNLSQAEHKKHKKEISAKLKFLYNIIHKKEDEYHKMLYEIESSLEKSLNGLFKFHTKDNFELNKAKETWMDTEFENDSRKGVRIEIQALRLNMYKLMFEITQNQKYKALENILKNEVRQKFFSDMRDLALARSFTGKIFADGLGDFTIRPNIFIAAYAYPKFLSNEEWEACFENALKSLWLNWGGVSTIDKNNPLFTEVSTGEDAKSYHRGDSWFWLNDLAALTLNKINNKRFGNQIKKIISASTEDILWKGCIGCHAELSSAKELSSKGCFSQAWSNAMYIEMIEGVLG